MVCCAAHADNQEGLHEHRDAEGVHGEACRVDLDAEDVDYTLPLLWVGLVQSCKGTCEEGLRGVNGRARGFAWREAVRQEHAVLAGKLLEGDGDEGANAAYYKDLQTLAWGIGAPCRRFMGSCRSTRLQVGIQQGQRSSFTEQVEATGA